MKYLRLLEICRDILHRIVNREKYLLYIFTRILVYFKILLVLLNILFRQTLSKDPRFSGHNKHLLSRIRFDIRYPNSRGRISLELLLAGTERIGN